MLEQDKNRVTEVTMTGTSDSDGMQEKKDSPMDVDFPNKEPESDYQPEHDGTSDCSPHYLPPYRHCPH